MTTRAILVRVLLPIVLIGVAVGQPSPSGQTLGREMPCAIPARIFSQMVSADKLFGASGLAWPQNVITVAFSGGSDRLYTLIEQTATKWTLAGGTAQLSFRNADKTFRQWTSKDVGPAAAIRIAFRTVEPDDGYWSVLGTMATNVNANEPTMNLDGFPEKLQPYLGGQNGAAWLASYEHSVVLHEFGHALGLSHEHFHQDCQKDLKLKEAIASLMQPPNKWTEEQARFNLDSAFYLKVLAQQAGRLTTTHVSSGTIDRESIMLYGFDDEFYQSRGKSACKVANPSGFATALSAGDRQFYLANYSKPRKPF